MRYKNITGQKFNRLVALRYLYTNKHRNSVWLFKCECGKEIEKTANTVKTQLTKSCGCLKIEVLSRKRGPLPLSTRIKIGCANSGANSNLWRGGVAKTNALIRESMFYKLWRKAVFERDNFQCQMCHAKGGWSRERKKQIILNADHIKPFAFFPDLRLSVSNGRTLCVECHYTTPTFGRSFYKEELSSSLKNVLK